MGSACPARIPPPPPRHTLCSFHPPQPQWPPRFFFNAPELSDPPLECSPRYLHVSLPGYSDPLLLLLREGFSGHNPYLCPVQSPSQLTGTPHPKSGSSVETDDVTCPLRECEWIYYSRNETFWGEENRGPSRSKTGLR